MIKWTLILALLLICLPTFADDLWRELVPDHGMVGLSISQEANGTVLLGGSWEVVELGGGMLEGDCWSIEPLGIGLSWGGFGSSAHQRFVGICYDDSIEGNWYERLGLHFKTPVKLDF